MAAIETNEPETESTTVTLLTQEENLNADMEFLFFE